MKKIFFRTKRIRNYIWYGLTIILILSHGHLVVFVLFELLSVLKLIETRMYNKELSSVFEGLDLVLEYLEKNMTMRATINGVFLNLKLEQLEKKIKENASYYEAQKMYMDIKNELEFDIVVNPTQKEQIQGRLDKLADKMLNLELKR